MGLIAPLLVQALFSGQSKTLGSSLQITGTKTIAAGNVMFLAFACDDAGSSFGVTDNLGNTYTQVKEQINTGNVKTQLWRAPVTIGGSLTQQTIAWTTSLTARAAASGEFAPVGALRLTDGNNGALGSTASILLQSSKRGELWVGAAGVEDDVAPTSGGSTGTGDIVVAGSSATSGSGSATNIAVSLIYILSLADASNIGLNGTNSGSQDNAGAGAIYSPVWINASLNIKQAVNRASTY
jgi:hypothetical protein